MAYMLTDLPEPDSPTRPSISPGATSKLTSRTADTVPCSVWKFTVRFLTSSSLVSARQGSTATAFFFSLISAARSPV